MCLCIHTLHASKAHLHMFPRCHNLNGFIYKIEFVFKRHTWKTYRIKWSADGEIKIVHHSSAFNTTVLSSEYRVDRSDKIERARENSWKNGYDQNCRAEIGFIFILFSFLLKKTLSFSLKKNPIYSP